METGEKLPVLVDRYELDVVDGAELLLPTDPTLIVYRFEGRLLGSAARESFAIALRPEDAAGLVRNTVAALQARQAARDAFGRES
jgi:hypothetical protein